jgi:hypothetical protein
MPVIPAMQEESVGKRIAVQKITKATNGQGHGSSGKCLFGKHRS